MRRRGAAGSANVTGRGRSTGVVAGVGLELDCVLAKMSSPPDDSGLCKGPNEEWRDHDIADTGKEMPVASFRGAQDALHSPSDSPSSLDLRNQRLGVQPGHQHATRQEPSRSHQHVPKLSRDPWEPPMFDEEENRRCLEKSRNELSRHREYQSLYLRNMKQDLLALLNNVFDELEESLDIMAGSVEEALDNLSKEVSDVEDASRVIRKNAEDGSKTWEWGSALAVLDSNVLSRRRFVERNKG